MPDYLLLTDVPILGEYGFTPGFSGESWFGTDPHDDQWQAYIVEGDQRLTFVRADDRLSRYMTRETFEELFG
jgi:hypothetical protein